MDLISEILSKRKDQQEPLLNKKQRTSHHALPTLAQGREICDFGFWILD